jgi:hypothetical protein
MDRYTVFGIVLESNFPFVNPLVRLKKEEDNCSKPVAQEPASTVSLSFVCSDKAPTRVDWGGLTTQFISQQKTDEGESLLKFFHLDGFDILCFGRFMDFYVWPDQLVCHLLEPNAYHIVEINLLGIVLSYWLEARSILALHASVVVIEDRAVAFLSGNKGGKSSLAASFMQLGFPLLTDDLLPVEIRKDACYGFPGYPAMRMWPDEAQHFTGSFEQLELVHPSLTKRRLLVGEERGFGRFCSIPRPLAAIYMPERQNAQTFGASTHITRLLPRDAILALLGHSFSPRLVEAAGLAPQRLETLARLASQVPVSRLSYPNGLEYLPAVRDTIFADLQLAR